MHLRDRPSIAPASWWPRRLTTRVTVATIIIVVLAGLVTLTILNGLLWYHLRAELLTTGDMLVEATGESLANALIDGDLVAIQETLDSATRNRDVVYAFAFAPQTPIVHTFAGGFPADLLQLVDTTDETMVRSTLLRTDTGLVRDFSYRPLDGLPAEVHLGISQAHIGTVQRQLSISILGLTAGGGLVAAAVAFAFSRIAIQPLATLTRQAQRLGKGYLDERLDLPAGDEVGDLAQAFNRMAAVTSDPEGVRTMLSTSQTFVQQHVQPWLPRFAKAVRSAPDSRFFSGLVTFTEQVIKADLAWIAGVVDDMVITAGLETPVA